jgi:hypothetical protein
MNKRLSVARTFVERAVRVQFCEARWFMTIVEQQKSDDKRVRIGVTKETTVKRIGSDSGSAAGGRKGQATGGNLFKSLSSLLCQQYSK